MIINWNAVAQKMKEHVKEYGSFKDFYNGEHDLREAIKLRNASASAQILFEAYSECLELIKQKKIEDL